MNNKKPMNHLNCKCQTVSNPSSTASFTLNLGDYSINPKELERRILEQLRESYNKQGIWGTSTINCRGSPLTTEQEKKIKNVYEAVNEKQTIKKLEEPLRHKRDCKIAVGDIEIDCNIEHITIENKQKGETKMTGLRIKKTDEMTIDEFKENTKAYDKIILHINKEKYDTFKKEYGKRLFALNDSEKHLINLVGDVVIEFKEKALLYDNGIISQAIPYSFIDKVICEYYIKTE